MVNKASDLLAKGGSSVPKYQSGMMIAPQVPQTYTSVSPDQFDGNIIYNLELAHDVTIDSVITGGNYGGPLKFGIYEKATDTTPAALGSVVLEQDITNLATNYTYTRTMLTSDIAIKAGSYWAAISAEGGGGYLNQIGFDGSAAAGPGIPLPGPSNKVNPSLAYKSGFLPDNAKVGGWQTHYYGYGFRTLTFSQDGMRVYWIGVHSSYYSYLESAPLSEAYNLSTAQLSEPAFPLFPDRTVIDWGGHPPKVTGLGISPDGRKIMMHLQYQAGSVRTALLQVHLSTPHDISTITFDPSEGVDLKEFTNDYELDNYVGTFADSGTSFWKGNNSSLFRYALTTPWDVQSLNVVRTDGWTIPNNGNDNSYFSCAINADTGKVIVTNTCYYGHSGKQFYFYEYSLTSGNTSVPQTGNQSLSWTNFDSRGWHALMGGNTLYFFTQSMKHHKFFMPTAWDLTGISQVGSVTSMYNKGDIHQFSTPPSFARGGAVFAKNGTEYWTFDDAGRIGVFPLAEAYNLRTLNEGGYTQHNIITILGLDQAKFYACTFKVTEDGTKLFVSSNTAFDGSSNYGWLHQFDFGTAWEPSTLTNPNKQYCTAIPTGNNLTEIHSFCISPDGRHMYVLRRGSFRKAWKFELSTPFDLSTVTYPSGKDLTILGKFGLGTASNSHYYNVPVSLEFGPDLKTMYLLFKANAEAYFKLSTIRLNEDANLNNYSSHSMRELKDHKIGGSTTPSNSSFQLTGQGFKRALFVDEDSLPYAWEGESNRDLTTYVKAGTVINQTHDGLPVIYLGVK